MSKRIISTFGLLMGSAACVMAQSNSPEDLRKELDALRGDYEKRINLLENRIRELETENAPAKPAPTTRHTAPRKKSSHQDSAVEQPPQAAPPTTADHSTATRNHAKLTTEKRFQENTEIRQLSSRLDAENLLAKRVEDVLEGYLDISGYFRAGYGRSNEGGPQRAFGIPGVAKYRLGNEAENYGELAFAKTFYPSGVFANGIGMGPNDPVARMVYRMAFVDSYNEYGAADDTNFTSPELWGSLANVIPGMPDAKVWAGNRFYRRHDIHINDFYFWDMSGGGGGIEDITLGNGKLAFAWIGDGARSSIYGNFHTADPNNEAGFSKSSFDVRYYDWKFLGGTGELGITYSNSSSGLDATGQQAPDADGFALSLVKTDQGFLDPKSLHKLSLQIANGPAKTFTSGFETFSNIHGTFIRPDPEESWRFRATDQIVINPIEAFSIGGALVYQYTDFGDQAAHQQWVSGGIRPIWHFTDHFNIALETGIDWVSDTLDGSGDGGTLGKLTLAPELSLGGDFFSRPVLRAFITYAMWDDTLQGTVGGPDYANQDNGWSWGIQMETWW